MTCPSLCGTFWCDPTRKALCVLSDMGSASQRLAKNEDKKHRAVGIYRVRKEMGGIQDANGGTGSRSTQNEDPYLGFQLLESVDCLL